MPRFRPIALIVAGLVAAALIGGSAGAQTARPLGVNDPIAITSQWHLRRDGLRRAWRKTLGSGVVVAVVDSGADLTHPDLRGNLWTNPGEIAGNGIDDDHDGFVDDVHGADLVDGDGDPSDQNGHGTHVAGILAARGNNGIGVSGVAPRARLMIVRALDAANSGTMDRAAAGLTYAVDHGAQVVNMSINGAKSTPALDAAVGHARQRGVLIVVSAGNNAADLDAVPSFPACSTAPNVIAVGSVGQSGRRSGFSDYGSCVDVTAPGEDIASTAMHGGYELRSGTSMAAPQVAGAAALVLAAHPHVGLDRLAAALSAQTRATRTAGSAPAPSRRLNAWRLLVATR